jgi:hypothetical protein
MMEKEKKLHGMFAAELRMKEWSCTFPGCKEPLVQISEQA